MNGEVIANGEVRFPPQVPNLCFAIWRARNQSSAKQRVIVRNWTFNGLTALEIQIQ